MNVIFSLVTVLSVAIIGVTAPEKLLAAFSSAAKNAINLTAALLSVYLIWNAFTKILDKSGLNKKLSKPLRPIIKFLFGVSDDKTTEILSLNLSCNMLGIGGVSTPTAIEAMKEMDENGNESGKTMLLVISSTSVQVLPLSVIQLLAETGGGDPSTVIIPTLITTAISTAAGIILAKAFA